jgi:hypothetical protein
MLFNGEAATMMLAQRIDALHEEQMGHAKNEMTGGTKKEFWSRRKERRSS